MISHAREIMLSAKERLIHLLDLAEKGPALRAALAEEVTDLLLDWPPDCPVAMRLPCEALLERAARDVDTATRARLALRADGHPELPVALLNALFFVASESLKKSIVDRNQSATDLPADGSGTDEAALVAAARRKSAFSTEFARLLGISVTTAQDILTDTSGQSLAVACKGAHVSRSAFSALSLLTAHDNKHLDVYETVPQLAAERMLHAWRAHNAVSAAAE
jgi:hypothetical protein